jgi:hypothetical protein
MRYLTKEVVVRNLNLSLSKMKRKVMQTMLLAHLVQIIYKSQIIEDQGIIIKLIRGYLLLKVTPKEMTILVMSA